MRTHSLRDNLAALVLLFAIVFAIGFVIGLASGDFASAVASAALGSALGWLYWRMRLRRPTQRAASQGRWGPR